ncbi:hypothetical protein K7711_25155 [Nocardia sp. CA2R105]|uniref:hypothetical protein n=1 Tax=Nocardia coffeae TaxID=2873381 RepID=UPI001CA6C305|nr:hypothetical protein [Nocardia coffeae]MBY8859780.1 hypothetical protein [Nocardia coffeae]
MSAESAVSETNDNGRLVRTVGTIVFLVVALVVYFLLLGRIAVALIASGNAAGIAMGVGVFILGLIGVWVVATSIRAALAHQHLARRIHEEGRELDVSDLPRRPSGRIEKDAADALFEQVKSEWEAAPDDWRNNYRAARAYDYAGDRTRAREVMRRAVALERAERNRQK